MAHDCLSLPTGTADLAARRFVRTDGRAFSLTSNEARLLAYLADSAGEDVSRDDLLVEVWGHAPTTLSRAADSAVARLRRKLEPVPALPRSLLTAHGDGYRLVLASSTLPALVPEPPQIRERWLHLGAVRVELESGWVERGGQVTPLSSQARALLRALHAEGGHPVARCVLARRIGLPSYARRALTTAIWRLRREVEVDPKQPRFVRNVRGRGYALALPERCVSEVVAPGEALWTLTTHAGRSLGLADCVLYLRQGAHLVQAAAFGPKVDRQHTIQDPLVLRIGDGIVGAAAASREAIRSPDVRHDSRYIADSHPARSELAVPLIHDGELVGVLDSESAKPDAFGEPEQLGLEAIGALMGPLALALAQVS